MTVKMQLFPSDEKDRYFHIYYNDRKHAAERENVERKIDRIVEFLEKNRGKKIPPSPNIEKYFNLEIYNKGKEDERLLACVRVGLNRPPTVGLKSPISVKIK